MKYAPFFLALLTLTAAAQQPFEWPLQPGDRVVIGGTLLQFEDTSWALTDPRRVPYDSLWADTFYMNFAPDALPFMEDMLETEWPWNHSISVALTRRNTLAYRTYTGANEFLPTSFPEEDTLWLYRYSFDGTDFEPIQYCAGTRTFDTTVFGESVRAFTTGVYNLDGSFQFSVTIGEGYWILRLEYPEWQGKPDLTLTRFKLGEKRHGIGPYIMDYPRFCDGLRYEYKGAKREYSGDNVESLQYVTSFRDTVIQGKSYQAVHRWYMNPFIDFPLWMPVREEGGRVKVWTGDKDSVVHPYTADLGDSTSFGWLVAIDTIDYNGERLMFTYDGTTPLTDGYRQTVIFYSGVGLIEYSSMLEWQFPFRFFSLDSFTPCTVGIEPPPPSLPRWEAVVYPSPARDYITLRIQHAPTAAPLNGTLKITDELGRTVRTQRWENVTGNSSLTLPVAGLAPGAYYYRLAGKHAWMAGQFVVGR